MKQRRLGKTRLYLSEIGFGGWQIGGDRHGVAYGPADDTDSRAAIRQALELGITFFDTADIFGYGHSEAMLGQELKQWSNTATIVATKGGVNFYRPDRPPEEDWTPYGLANAVEQSLARLRRDTLDLYMLMNPPMDELLRHDRVWETLASLQRAGKIQAIGVNVTHVDEGVALLNAKVPVDALEVTYSIFDQAAVIDLLPLAQKRRVGIIAREPLANGFLTGKYQSSTTFPPTDQRATVLPEYVAAAAGIADQLRVLEQPGRTLTQAALRFVLDHPVVTSVIPGMRSAAQVRENVQASALSPLTGDDREQIHNVFFASESES